MVTRKKPAKKVARKRVARAPAAPAAPAAPKRVRLGGDAPASKRVRLSEEDHEAASDYFTSLDKESLEFVSTGNVVLDCALGGGWCVGRVVNLVGDKSSGKTLQAIEACANFKIQYTDGVVRYGEAEAAFDKPYAEALGMPVHDVIFNDDDKPFETVEDFHDELMSFIEKYKGRPMLFILDSLDALSDDAEMKRDFDEDSYGGTKSKQMSQMFRRIVRTIEKERVLLIVISQLRDSLAKFGEKQKRSGGRALDFYSSHVVWLHETGRIMKTIDGVDRVVGVSVKAKVRKNKVGLPHRECEYPIIFGYGVDDITSGVEWLISIKRQERLKELGMSEAGYKLRVQRLRDKGGEEMRELRMKLKQIVADEWQKLEQKFLPKSRKYA